jgi:hypothetical protein
LRGMDSRPCGPLPERRFDMTLNKFTLGLIGRHHPEIYDVLRNQFGRGMRQHGDEVYLNPQPLPPVEAGLALGFDTAAELVRLAFSAHYLGLTLDIDIDDWCATPPRINLPFTPRGSWVPPVPSPEPWPIVGESFNRDYLAGIAYALEVSENSWRDLRVADVIEKLHDAAFDRASNLETVAHQR